VDVPLKLVAGGDAQGTASDGPYPTSLAAHPASPDSS
jgi:hypothetical protein